MWWLIPVGTFVSGFFVGIGAILWSIGENEVLVRRNPNLLNQNVRLIFPSRSSLSRYTAR